MKKIMIVSLMLLMLASQVFAQSNQNQQNGLVTAGNILAEKEQIREQNQERLQQGLQTALGQVTDTNARMRIESNIDKFQNQYQTRLGKMEEVAIVEVNSDSGSVKIRAREQVKYFGFIPGTAVKRFNINGEGQIIEEHPWYRFMYTQ